MTLIATVKATNQNLLIMIQLVLLKNLVLYQRKEIKKIKKHDILIESLHAEIARLKTLIPDDDSGKSCELVYAELTSLRNVHASTLEQFKAEKDKNEKHVYAIVEPTSCDKCELFKLKLKDADVRIA